MSAIPRAAPPCWLWVYLPVLVLLLERAAFLRDYTWYDVIYTESGLVENLTAVASALAVGAGIAALRHRTRLPPWLRGWVVFVTLACVYATGEELNWGQFIFGWSTPEWLMAIQSNGYGTSLSGIDGRVEEAPKILLELFVLCGIINVLLQRGVERRRDGDWFWPTYICLPTALLAILVRVPESLQAWFWMDMSALYWSGWDELEEFYLALFLFLYLLSCWYRLGMEERG